MTLEQVLQARRTMDYLATSGTIELFELAKQDYFSKLNDFQNASKNQNTVQQFVVSEELRAKQLTLFNHSGSVHEYNGNNETIRERAAIDGSKSSGI